MHLGGHFDQITADERKPDQPERGQPARRDVVMEFISDGWGNRMALEHDGCHHGARKNRGPVVVAIVHNEPVDKGNPVEVSGDPVTSCLRQQLGVIDRVVQRLVWFEWVEHKCSPGAGDEPIPASVSQPDTLGQTRQGFIKSMCARGARTGHLSTIGVGEVLP